MACVPCFFLLFLALFSTTYEARESQFFPKASNNNDLKEANTNQQVAPYGHASGQLAPWATNSNNDTNNNVPNHGTEVAKSGKNCDCLSIGNLTINTNMISNEGYTTVGYYKKNENSFNNSNDEGWLILNSVALVVFGVFVGVMVTKVQNMCNS